jgi:hypothetical protein
VVFELNYKIEKLGVKNGLVWDVIVPAITTGEKVTSYNLKIFIPKRYGEVFSIQPKPKKITRAKSRTELVFDKAVSFGKSIFASFGNEQQISFRLKVPLENKNFLSKQFSIHVPPDTPKQQILFTKMEPKPKRINKDEAGNLVAQYSLSGGEYVEVQINGVAKITSSAKTSSDSVGIASTDLAKYRDGGMYVTVNDKLMQEKAGELKELDEIYDFVVNFMAFDKKAYESGEDERKKAAVVLKTGGETTNLGFVDLFTSLAKASGFATRQVYGLPVAAGTSVKPIFVGSPLNIDKVHVWAQVYDEEDKTWLNVDPTWGSTTGFKYIHEDLSDRIALLFSNSGDDTDGLKNLTVSSGNISVSPAKRETQFEPKVEMKIVSDQVFAGFPVDLKVVVENKRGLTLSNSTVTASSEDVDLLGDETVDLPTIFPFETKEFKFKLRANNLIGTRKGKVEVKYQGRSGETSIIKSGSEQILVKGFFSLGVQQLLLVLLVILVVAGTFSPKIFKKKR